MFSEFVPDEFRELNDAVKIIWTINKTNSDAILAQTIKNIENNILSIERVFNLISCMHTSTNDVIFPFCLSLANHFHVQKQKIYIRSPFLRAFLFYHDVIVDNSSSHINEKMAISVYPESSIQYAIRADDIQSFQEICMSIESMNPDQIIRLANVPYPFICVTMLSAAAFYGAVNCFKFMVANYNVSETMFDTQFFTCAVIGGNPDIINLCDQKSIKFNSMLVSFAIYYHRDNVAAWLIEKYDADISFTTSLTTLNLPFFFYKLSLGINESDTDSRHAVHAAVIANCMDILRYLVNHGADINAVDSHSESPLHIALIAENYDMAKYIVDSGGDVMRAKRWMDVFSNRDRDDAETDMLNYLLRNVPKTAEEDQQN